MIDPVFYIWRTELRILNSQVTSNARRGVIQQDPFELLWTQIHQLSIENFQGLGFSLLLSACQEVSFMFPPQNPGHITQSNFCSCRKQSHFSFQADKSGIWCKRG